jgi:hypothetical protein
MLEFYDAASCPIPTSGNRSCRRRARGRFLPPRCGAPRHSRQVIHHDGVVVGTGATILTTRDGAPRLAEHGFSTRVIDVTLGFLYTKGCAAAE